MTTDAPERPKLNITMPTLHVGQRQVQLSDSRFRVVCCGRRWGKTLLGMSLLFEEAMVKGGRCWWVAPSYKEALEGWRYLLTLVNQLPRELVQVQTGELLAKFMSGGEVQIRTGREPDELRGAGLNAVVIDEAATIKEESWALALRPALADRGGWAMFIGTPKHFNHFYEWWLRGEDPENADWASWQFPTWTNPYIPPEEIEAAQRDMEPHDFDQEFGASFTAIGGAIFPRLALDRPFYLRPMPDHLPILRTGVGMDWGTTPQHQASVVCGSMLKSGEVWIRSAWLNPTGDENEWFSEAERCRRDYGADFARIDRSQSSAHSSVIAKGYSDVDNGVADVEARIGAYQGLIRPRRIFFDLNGPGVKEFFVHLCEYHRIPDGEPKAGQPEEVNDDDVDAGGYLLKELTDPRPQYGLQAGGTGRLLSSRSAPPPLARGKPGI